MATWNGELTHTLHSANPGKQTNKHVCKLGVNGCQRALTMKHII